MNDRIASQQKKRSRIYLSPPHMSGCEMEYVKEAFDTNWIAPLGPHVDAFEREVASRVGVAGALALSSGTAALHLALKLLGIGPGDRVFCSSLTFSASVNPVLYEGGVPVFLDAEPESWNMSPSALERALADAAREKALPRAVIVVDLYGQSADMDPLQELCGRYGVPLVEDAAESLGATYKGRESGTFGVYGIYSFNGNKVITTGGGGMLVAHDPEAIRKARFWATQARDPAPHYQHSEIGYNYRMSNLLAAVGRGQLTVLDDRIRARRAIFERYVAALGDLPGVTFMPEPAWSRSNRWLSVLTLDPGATKHTPAELLAALEAENIEARPVWKPMHLQPVFSGALFYPHGGVAPEAASRGEPDPRGSSVSDRLFATGLCLPSGSGLAEEEQHRVIRCVRRCLEART